MQTTVDKSKISKTVRRDHTFTFDVLSESLIGFVSFLVLLRVEHVVSYT